jgi:hypothetical protein
MAFQVEYSSTRGEIWHWYWRVWRQRLWKIHAAIMVLTVFMLVARVVRGGSGVQQDLLLIAGCGGLALLWFVLHPQLLYKPQLRRLAMDAEGLSTTIGRHSGQRRWDEISAIENYKDAIIIQGRNGNAFIVPDRAFASRAAREAFLAFAQSKLAASQRSP